MSESLQKLRHYDTLVVGSGLSGLTAAITSAESGKRTAILTKGAGTLSIGGGVIDLLGYVDGMAVKDPEKALIQLPETHPYRIVGPDKVMEAIQYF